MSHDRMDQVISRNFTAAEVAAAANELYNISAHKDRLLRGAQRDGGGLAPVDLVPFQAEADAARRKYEQMQGVFDGMLDEAGHGGRNASPRPGERKQGEGRSRNGGREGDIVVW